MNPTLIVIDEQLVDGEVNPNPPTSEPLSYPIGIYEPPKN